MSDRRKDRGEGLRKALEDALLGLDDTELPTENIDVAEVRGIAQSVLRKHGFAADGSPATSNWSRSRLSRKMPPAARPLRETMVRLRASFSAGGINEGSDDAGEEPEASND
jgi:hypothetical protein